MRAAAAGLLLLASLPTAASAATLDINTSYRMRAVSYTNLNLSEVRNDRSFITQNAQLRVFIAFPDSSRR